jgi:hypothetical protein
MLAHLIDEQHPTCEPMSLDPTLAAPPTGDQEAFADAAYEAGAAARRRGVVAMPSSFLPQRPYASRHSGARPPLECEPRIEARPARRSQRAGAQSRRAVSIA